ncbi:MAG: hypothetical protein ACXVHL_36600, partial [Solirubrobacteraceae bacterium]
GRGGRRARQRHGRERVEQARAPQRRRSPLAIASPVAGILLAVTLWSAGVFDSGSSKPSTPASAAAKSHPSDAGARPHSAASRD